jgi:hypothetical protein
VLRQAAPDGRRERLNSYTDRFRHYLTWRVAYDAAARRNYVNPLIDIRLISQ